MILSMTISTMKTTPMIRLVKKNDGGPLRGSVIVLDYSSNPHTSISERRATRRAFHLINRPSALQNTKNGSKCVTARYRAHGAIAVPPGGLGGEGRTKFQNLPLGCGVPPHDGRGIKSPSLEE